MDKLKVCIVGAGQESRASHIPNLQRLTDMAELTALCDINEAAARDAAEKYGIARYYGSHIAMLETEKPDMVTVCVPNRFHADIVLDALHYGCHVLCEKPPAITSADAERMEQAAVKAGKLLTYNFHYRQAPEVQTIKRMIEANDFGRVYAGKAIAVRRRGIPGWGNFTNKELQGGGPLMDIGVHMLDAALYLMGYPEAEYVCANAFDAIGHKGGVGTYGAWDGARYTVEDSLFGFVGFRDGRSLLIESAFALNCRENQTMNVELFGEQRGASVFTGELYRSEADGMMVNESFRPIAEANRRAQSISGFVRCCLSGEAPLVTPSQGTALMRLVEGLYRSAEQGTPMKL